MMNLKKLLSLIILAIAFISCVTNKLEEPTTPQGAQNLNDLKADPNLNWTTMRTIKVSILGIPFPGATQKENFLLWGIGKNSSRDTFYIGRHDIYIDTDFNQVVVPTALDSIRLTVNKIERSAKIDNTVTITLY